jgi:hypothetical protein
MIKPPAAGMMVMMIGGCRGMVQEACRARRRAQGFVRQSLAAARGQGPPSR